METTSDRAERILDAAEARARRVGYQGFSFRELAADVGVKSSSVHYHFPTKEELASSLARRYSERFMDALGDPASPSSTATERLDRYVSAFRHSLTADKSMCLCGMFGAEIDGLPAALHQEVRAFFTANVKWLTTALGGDIGNLQISGAGWPPAIHVLAALEGALMLARAQDDIAVFDAVARQLVVSLDSEMAGAATPGPA